MTDIVDGTPVDTTLDPNAAATPQTPAAPSTPPPAAPEVIGETPAPAAPEAAPEGEAFAYKETGDPGLDVALGFLGGLGFAPSHPAIVDAIDGKFDKLEAHLGALGDKAKGWERMVALAKDAYTRTSTQAEQTQREVTEACHAVVGGPEQWNEIKQWAGTNAEPAEKDAINGMLSAGPVQARAAALLLADAYGAANGTTVSPKDPVAFNATTAAPSAGGALSPAAYAQAVRELRATLGGRDLDTHPDYQKLQARRLAFRG